MWQWGGMPRGLGDRELVRLVRKRRWNGEDARAVLKDLDASGLSVGEFAAQYALEVQRLYRWRAELGNAAPRPAPAFVEIKPAATRAIEVALRSGYVVSVPDGFREEMLRRVVAVLDGQGRAVLSLPPSVRLFVATQPVDGRKRADSLMVIVRDVFKQDPLSGHLFIFFSKRCDRVRVVYRDRNGFPMWTKRLEAGRFRPTFSSDGKLASLAVEAAELALIVEGIDLAGAHRRRRWQPARELEKSSRAAVNS
jgi:transposase